MEEIGGRWVPQRVFAAIKAVGALAHSHGRDEVGNNLWLAFWNYKRAGFKPESAAATSMAASVPCSMAPSANPLYPSAQSPLAI